MEGPIKLGDIMPVARWGSGSKVYRMIDYRRKEVAGHGMTMARGELENRGRRTGSCPPFQRGDSEDPKDPDE